MAVPMPAIASTAPWVACWMPETWAAMSSVARAVWLARLFTSAATTAKPLPASPARAASMVALSASRLVWPAMSLISFTTSPILRAIWARLWIEALVRWAVATASLDMREERATCVVISATEAESCSAAVATVWTLAEVWRAAAAIACDCLRVAPVAVSTSCADPRIWPAVAATVSTAPRTVVSSLSASAPSRFWCVALLASR